MSDKLYTPWWGDFWCMIFFGCFSKIYLLYFQIEARSIEHVKGVAKGLENKIIELQQKLDAKVRT